MSIKLLWIVFIYVLIALVYWGKDKTSDKFDLFAPLNGTKGFSKFLSWVFFIISAAIVFYFVYAFIDSSIGLIFIGCILFGYTLYAIKKNNLIGQILDTLNTAKERAELAAEKSIFPAIAGAGCFLLLSLGVLFYISDRYDESSDDSTLTKTVQSLQTLGKVSTLQFDVKSILEPEKWNSDELLYSMNASIETGVDLTSINSDAVSIKKSSIKLTLPKPEVISTNVKLESGEIVYSSSSILRRDFTDKDRREENLAFENKITNPEFVADLCKQTEQPTIMFFRNFLTKLGFENIEINFQY